MFLKLDPPTSNPQTVCVMHLEASTVVEHESAGGDYRLLTITAPRIAGEVAPGQFVSLRLDAPADAVLRRPFSVCDAGAGRLTILYKPVGRGTHAMLDLRAGDRLSLLGPLGHGFPLPPPDAPLSAMPVLVAGGYGVAPLYLLARRYPRRGLLFVGGATGRDILMTSAFAALGWDVRVATEDGSLGEPGRVTTPLDAWLAACEVNGGREFFACGPTGLLRAVAKRAAAGGDRAWVSLDRHMGCGVGACLACVQRLHSDCTCTHEDRRDGEKVWGRVCKEGPVFDAANIVWEETTP